MRFIYVKMLANKQNKKIQRGSFQGFISMPNMECSQNAIIRYMFGNANYIGFLGLL